MNALKQYPNWVGHINKIPMNANTGQRAKSNEPSTWAPLVKAWNAHKYYNWDGVGWMFAKDTGIVGIDLDKCVNGAIESWAEEIVDSFNSYTEISPSGKGLHIFVKGEIPHALKIEGIEIYAERRYFTVTGNKLFDSPIKERQQQLDSLFSQYKRRPVATSITPQECSIEKVRSALSVLPTWFDNYYDWLSICMAVHSVFPDSLGVSLIEEWAPGKEGEVERMFASLSRGNGQGVTVATLFHMAIEHGWQVPLEVKFPQYEAKRFCDDGVWGTYYKVDGVWYHEGLIIGDKC